MNKPTSPGFPSRLAVTYRAVGDLIPDPRNARTHPKRQIDQIRASIEAFGFTNPILADSEGHVIAGHGRLLAARAMGFAEVPTITLSGLSETQKRALRLAMTSSGHRMSPNSHIVRRIQEGRIDTPPAAGESFSDGW